MSGKEISKTIWEFINHQVFIGGLIISVLLYINNGDTAAEKRMEDIEKNFIKIQVQQEALTHKMDNDLPHIQAAVDTLKKDVSTNREILSGVKASQDRLESLLETLIKK